MAMIVRKKASMSRTTGEVLSEEIVEPVNMTRDEYWEPFIRIMGPEIIKNALEQTKKIS